MEMRTWPQEPERHRCQSKVVSLLTNEDGSISLSAARKCNTLLFLNFLFLPVVCLLVVSFGGGERHVPRRAAIGGLHPGTTQDVHGPCATRRSPGGDVGPDRVPGEIPR